MIALVPRAAHADLLPLVSDLPATLVPYDEEGPLPDETAEAQVVFRWIAGKAYARLVEAGPKVSWLHTASAGMDHVLCPEIETKSNLVVTDSGDAFPTSIGEFTLAWMLAHTHRVPDFLALGREKRWEWTVHGELAGQTVGVVGLGPIGRGIASRCRALGMRTLGYRRSPASCPDVDETLSGPEGLARLLAESDWLILACALTDETRGLLGAAELGRMKPGAKLVNVARGPVVNEAALLESLRSGHLSAAVLDVFDTEPLPAESPFWDMPNVYVTCHISGWTEGLRRRQRELFVENLRRFTLGEPLIGVVDLARGY
jgi:phosphoglycerate dehydrogenase-like enzyme